MGWDVMLFPAGYQETKARREVIENLALGSKATVIATIKRHCPEVKFDEDENFGAYDDGDSCIEFIIGTDEDPVKTLSLELHGSVRADNRLNAICGDTGWEVFDTGSGEFVRFNGTSWE